MKVKRLLQISPPCPAPFVQWITSQGLHASGQGGFRSLGEEGKVVKRSWMSSDGEGEPFGADTEHQHQTTTQRSSLHLPAFEAARSESGLVLYKLEGDPGQSK